MSKFADKLKRVFRNTNQAIGFRKPSADEQTPSILIMVDIGSATLKKIKELSTAEPDAFLIDGIEGDAAKISKATGNIPLGIVFKEGINIPAGNTAYDFVIFGLKAGADLPVDESKGKLLVITESMAPGMIKAINDLDISVDGVLIDFNGSPVDIQFILTCHLFNDLLNKPLLVRIYKSDINDSEIKALNAAGVQGLWLPGDISVTGIKKIKRAIKSLPVNPRKSKRETVLIPGLGSAPKEPEEMEEVEDDE